ncbi:MAG: transposase [Verrucomicrobiae bacterium]|nr:transposase [Verrucomicrobiae bacterium]
MFAALNVDIATGNVLSKGYRRHHSVEFRKFLQHIDQRVDPQQVVHPIIDNYSTNKTRLVKVWLFGHPRFHLHFIPTHSSWPNQCEHWFAF